MFSLACFVSSGRHLKFACFTGSACAVLFMPEPPHPVGVVDYIHILMPGFARKNTELSFVHNDDMSHVMKKTDFLYAKTKTQISFAVNAKLISTFVFRYIDSIIQLLPRSEISSL